MTALLILGRRKTLDWLSYVIAFLSGCLLGIFFFGGLWWTVQKITGSGRPYLIAVVSFIVRTAVVLAGMFIIIKLGWVQLFLTLAGFIITRTLLTGWLNRSAK